MKFHWESLGTAISDSINGFFAKFDFALAGQAITNWTTGIFSSAISAVKGVAWEDVGAKIVELLSNVDLPKITLKIGELGVEFQKGLGDLAKGIFKGEIEAIFKLKPGDSRTEEWTKVLLWLQKLLLAPTISAKLKILSEGPGIDVAKLFTNQNDVEKNAKVNVQEGELDPSVKKGGKMYNTYNGYQDKTPKIGLDTGDVSSSLKQGGFVQYVFDKYVNKVAKIGLTNGNIAAELKSGGALRATYDYIKDKSPKISLAASITQGAYDAKTIVANVYNKSATVSLGGSVSSSAWDVYAIITKVANTVTNIALGAIKGIATGGVFKNGKWSPITAYAGGGAPNMGQMFIAREAGPELVGRIGGHTAVMNNDQIVSSVAAGVAAANSSQNALLQQLLNAVQGGNQTVVLQLDSTRFGEVAIRSINRVQRQQGRTLINV